MSAKFKAYSITDLGGRKENQDSFLLLQKSSESGKYVLLAAVADGAGGFGEGQTASRGLLDCPSEQSIICANSCNVPS